MFKCDEFRRLLRERYVVVKKISGHRFYVMRTRKKDADGKYIDLILHNCPACGRGIFPHTERIKG